MTIGTQPGPIDLLQSDLDEPDHPVVWFRGPDMEMAGVAGDETIVKGEGPRLGEVLNVPLADVAGVVVALKGVDAAAVIGVTGKAGPVDGVLEEIQFSAGDLLGGRNTIVTVTAVLRPVVVGVDIPENPLASDCAPQNNRENDRC